MIEAYEKAVTILHDARIECCRTNNDIGHLILCHAQRFITNEMNEVLGRTES